MLYYLTHALLDNVAIDITAKFEESLYFDMKTHDAGKALACQIQETKQLPDENTMNQYITDFKKRFM